MGLKMPELLIIMAILFLLFGASRLPQIGSSLGSAIRNFKKGFAGDDDEAGKPPPGAQGKISDASSTEPGASTKVSSKEH